MAQDNKYDNATTRDTTLGIASATAMTSAIVFARFSCQALVLVLSVRLLGVENFGLITAVVAISLLLGPWGGLGFDFVAQYRRHLRH